MSSSHYHNTKGAMYFVHVHLANDPQCYWYADDDTGFGLAWTALSATAGNRVECDAYVKKLIAVGVNVQEAILWPCDSTAILTPDMQKVLNIA